MDPTPRQEESGDHAIWARVRALGQAVADLGAGTGLPYVAICADIASPAPMRDIDGQPFAQTLFRWIQPEREYWNERSLALESPFLLAARVVSEPFFFADGRFGAWRPIPALDGVDTSRIGDVGVAAGIIAPVHQPRAVGAIVWVSPDPALDIRAIYADRAEHFQATAARFIGAYADAAGLTPAGRAPPQLTRREIQCVKLAAGGKTDDEIAAILALSRRTATFHVQNAASKLGASSRSQTVHLATRLGYIGAAVRS